MLTVPAEVQRNQDVRIDDELEVSLIGVSSLIDRASFESRQIAGDRVTVPADVARQLSLVAGDEYEVEFEKIEEEEEDDIEDEEFVLDADPEPSAEELIEEMEEETEEEEEEEGLGALFA